MLWLWMLAPTANWSSGPGLMAAGLCSWTLLEYLLHRLMLHRVEPFRGWHLQHHLHPDVPMRRLVGHLLQEIVHHRLHMAAHPVNPWLLERWREHAFHHHRDEYVGYGTLTGFWDGVLGTSTTR
jgi:cyclopropane-fatty-acyl-phospholipid synthase